MNSDRLIQMSSDTIVTGLTTKWMDAYSFLGFTFSSTQINNGITFDSLNKNQFALDLAYYLEPEDVLFLLFQTTDALIQVTDGTTTIQLTQANLKQILAHKWVKAITQLNSTLNSITTQDDFITYNFTLGTTDLSSKIEGEIFAIRHLMSNYFEKYTDYSSQNLIYPNVSFAYKINWDVIKARFSYRMQLGYIHNLTLNKSEFKSLVGKKLSLTGYIDGVPNTDLTFVSSDPSIATVDLGGLITLITLGSCNITVTETINNTQAICQVTVIDKELFIDQNIINLRTGTKKINAFINGVKTLNINFSSSNTDIALVSSDGIISKGTQEGTCIITVTDNVSGLFKTCKVNNRAESFSLDFMSKTVQYGSTLILRPHHNDVYTKNVTYQISDTNLATINNGILTVGNIKGSCTITIIHVPTNKTTSCIINVVKQSLYVYPGNLANLLGSNYLTITDLTLSGYLNSSDVQIILNMVQTNGALKALDLERCKFIVDKQTYTPYSSNSQQIINSNTLPVLFLNNSTKLTSFVLPRAIQTIGYCSFSYSSIQSINIPNSIKEIQQYAFQYCTSLSSITFEDSVIPLTIRAKAFWNLGSNPMSSLTLPSRTIYIEGGVLDYSDNIKTLTVLSVTPPTLTASFGGSLTTIYVPAESVAAYKAAPVWSTYSSMIKAIV